MGCTQGVRDACHRAQRIQGLMDMIYEHLSVEIQDFITDMRGPRPVSASRDAMSGAPSPSVKGSAGEGAERGRARCDEMGEGVERGQAQWGRRP